MILNGIAIQDMPGWGTLSYNLIIEQEINGIKKKMYSKEIKDQIDNLSRRINHYNSEKFEIVS